MTKRDFVAFDEFFNLYLNLFKIVGIRLNSKDKNSKKLTFQWLNLMYCIVCYSLLIMHVTQIILFISRSELNFEAKLGVIPAMINEITAFSKFLCIFLNKEKIERILSILKKRYDQQKLNQVVDRQYLFKYAKIIITYSKLLLILVPVFLSIPCLATLNSYLTEQNWNAFFPAELWYPFNPKDFYVPVYMYLVFMGINFSLNMMVTDSLFLMILVNITHQFKELSREFKNLNDKKDFQALVNRQIELRE